MPRKVVVDQGESFLCFTSPVSVGRPEQRDRFVAWVCDSMLHAMTASKRSAARGDASWRPEPSMHKTMAERRPSTGCPSIIARGISHPAIVFEK